jgi:hypothetical protein
MKSRLPARSALAPSSAELPKWLLSAILLLVVACGGDAGDDDDDDDPPPPPATMVDVLFVIDDSLGMAEHQTALTESAPAFLNGLTNADGLRLDLRVAVVSTNLGSSSAPMCEGDGDGGRFLSAALGMGCTGPTDAFIRDGVEADCTPDPMDESSCRVRNFTGQTLGETFACIANLGTAGCGFEQPLEAMRKALSGEVPENAGFLRDDALLVVVILGNEDDCSAQTALFQNTPEAETAYGPFSSFRCFEHGVVCDPDDPRTPGVKSGCRSREDSTVVYPVASYVEFLLGLKSHPARVKVVVLSTPADGTASVVMNGENFNLDTACGSNSSTAIRLAEFASSFAAGGATGDVCTDMFDAALATVAPILL